MAFILVSGAAAQQDDLRQLALAQPILDFHVSNATIDDTLQLLARAEGIEIRVEKSISTGRLNASFRKAAFADVFMLLLKSRNLTYEVIDTTTVVVKATPKK